MGVPVRLNLRMDVRFRWTENRAIWLLTVLVIVGYPVTSAFYWNFVLQAGVLPTDTDSISIVVFRDLIVATILAVPILGLTILALVLKAGPFRPWSWDKGRPILSVVWSLALGVPAILLVSLGVADSARSLPWYEYVWHPHLGLVVAWLLVLRGAALSHVAR